MKFISLPLSGLLFFVGLVTFHKICHSLHIHQLKKPKKLKSHSSGTHQSLYIIIHLNLIENSKIFFLRIDILSLLFYHLRLCLLIFQIFTTKGWKKGRVNKQKVIQFSHFHFFITTLTCLSSCDVNLQCCHSNFQVLKHIEMKCNFFIY